MSIIQFFMRITALTGVLVVSQTSAFAQGDPLFAVLVGGNEVSAAGQANQGNLSGFGTATANISIAVGAATGTVCFGITVRGIDAPTAAHIHQARAGLSGPIVVGLTAPLTGNPGASSGCVNNVAVALINQLRLNPANFYVNVHTGLFPAGALRGQLF